MNRNEWLKRKREEMPERLCGPEKSLAVARTYSKIARPLMSLVLYLCSTTPEFRDAHGTDKLPARAKPTKTKRGERIFAPDRPTIWETGYHIGRLIGQARADRNYSRGRRRGNACFPLAPHPKTSLAFILERPERGPEKTRTDSALAPADSGRL